MIYFSVIVIEFIIILGLLAFQKHRKVKPLQTCGNCLQEAAYERFEERKRILSLTHTLYQQVPSQLYAGTRRQSIAKHACLQMYLQLKKSLETPY